MFTVSMALSCISVISLNLHHCKIFRVIASAFQGASACMKFDSLHFKLCFLVT